MGILKWLAIAGVAGLTHHAIRTTREENERLETERRKQEEIDRKRRSTPCLFKDEISQEEFQEIINRILRKSKKRVYRYSINGPIVTGNVISQSGASTWTFTLDFNDYGHITGKCWVSSLNTDSKIPDHLASLISDELCLHIERTKSDGQDTDSPNNYSENKENSKSDSVKNGEETDDIELEDDDFLDAKDKERIKKEIKNSKSLRRFAFWHNKRKIGIGSSSREFKGDDVKDVLFRLYHIGFLNIETSAIKDIDADSTLSVGAVEKIIIDGKTSVFSKDLMVPYNSNILIIYHAQRKIEFPFSSKEVRRMDYKSLAEKLQLLGFINLKFLPVSEWSFGFFHDLGQVKQVIIDDIYNFTEGLYVNYDSEITIKYYVSK